MKVHFGVLTPVLVLVSAICSGQNFIADPASLSISYNIGDATPAAVPVSLTSSGAAMFFTAAASTTSGGNWLSASASVPVTPSTLNVSVDPTGLGIGVYQGTVTLTPVPTGTVLVYHVTFNVNAAGTPAITMVGNALGYQAKLAPGVVFVAKGSNLGGVSLAQGVAPNYQNILNGTSVTFTPIAGGAAINGKMVYTLNFQIAGFLPSSATPGVYAVRVTFNGLTSAPFNITVVARSYGIASADSSGVGLAQATIGNINAGISLTRFTAGNVAFGGFNWVLGPTHAGDTLVFWGTGGGADAANDTGGSSGDQTVAGNFRVLVQGRQITPFFAGASSGYPGLFQINFTLPADLTVDCFATAQVSAGGELSNIVNIPIAAAGQTSCSDPNTPAAILSKLDSGSNITFATFSIGKLTVSANGSDTTREAASGAVFVYTPSQWINNNSGQTFGACRVYDTTFTGTTDPNSAATALDAGSKLPLSGPNVAANFGLTPLITPSGSFYNAQLTTGTLAGGTYNLTGPGGTQVGSFSTSTVFPTSFTALNFSSITLIDRTQPLIFTWSGSNVDKVAIAVGTSVTVNNIEHNVSITCIVSGALGTFTVPAGAVTLLSPVAANGTDVASVSLSGVSVPGSFAANLISGGQIDKGSFLAIVGVSKNVAVQ